MAISESLKYSCLKDVISESHPTQRRQFDDFREKINLWVAPKDTAVNGYLVLPMWLGISIY